MKTSSNEEKIILAEKLLKDAWNNMDELHCGSAMPIADHAVTIYRSLAQDEPLFYDPMLAYSYNTLGMAYSFMNLLDDAEDDHRDHQHRADQDDGSSGATFPWFGAFVDDWLLGLLIAGHVGLLAGRCG